jgi:hypothetical protein
MRIPASLAVILQNPVLTALAVSPWQPVTDALKAQFIIPGIRAPVQADLQCQATGKASQLGHAALMGRLLEPHQWRAHQCYTKQY